MQDKKDLELQYKQLQQEKEQLVAEQKAGGKAWTKEKQERLDSVVENLVDVTEALENMEASEGKYVPEPGTEGFYHVSMIKGTKKFDPETGKQIAFPFIQTFTQGEYKHFSVFGRHLGYTDITVLWDPTKNKK